MKFEKGKLYEVTEVTHIYEPSKYSHGGVVTDTFIYKTVRPPNFSDPSEPVPVNVSNSKELKVGDVFLFLGYCEYQDSKYLAAEKALYILMGDSIWRTNEPLSMLLTHVTFQQAGK